ncbi:protein-L-isoaspartate O-methyltransferase family protein [Aliirhizobium smilacinae]|uniref:Protein-L-isoaspartate O-methyltransferase n=1 Tax=Aliirhizobium smilacinae TaxID=1395944 RepID=A0A5C4XQ92_9HYPH|nr:methyltransferase domain-containing protein [Rhizobium smilacinae]TNM65543.1 methyltransferase domain-containing protein [Rhizobium smilacinae]
MSFETEPAHRRNYALQLLAKAGIDSNERLLAAFARVPREDYVGPPPWIFNDVFSAEYHQVASTDPVVLYQDVLVGLDTEKGINNGSPSLHVAALHAFKIREGETVVHMGAGAGYYTAIMAELVGPSGRVIAVEYDASLAERARANLSSYDNVEVVRGDATEWPRETADIIYANFALDHPPQAWIDNLAPYGRMIFPLGIPAMDNGKRSGFTRYAAYLMIDRQAQGFGARFLQTVSFIWGESSKPVPAGRHAGLETAFRARGMRKVRSLRWKSSPTDQEWYGEEDWGLSFDEP